MFITSFQLMLHGMHFRTAAFNRTINRWYSKRKTAFSGALYHHPAL